MGIADILDAVSTMVDIVKGGIDAYKAGEKLDELIEKSISDYENLLSDSEKNLHKQYLKAKEAYEKHASDSDHDVVNEFMQNLEDCQIIYLGALNDNTSLPKSFRDEIKSSLEEFRRASNMPLERLNERFMKRAKTEEEKELVKKIIDEAKTK